ncbi:hypothetical protein CRYUN_Cryun21dG0046200 [Craigia yunnanensis]
MSLVFWILILNLWILKATSLQAGSRTLLREIGNNNGGSDPKDYAIELNVTNFDGVLKDTPATYTIVEFFAHWCPACRNYKPHYEKVARLFNGPDAVHPGIILMTRVDCALKINTKLCDKFSVDHYPMLFWGPPTKFSAGWEPNQAKGEIRLIDDGRTAERLLNWINKQISSSYGLDDEKFENEHLPSNISDPGQIARAVYDVEEATTTAFDIILEHKVARSLQAGSRTVLREIGNNNDGSDPKDYAVELNVTNVDGVLKDTPATYAIVEFFAHWCPACRNYKPHYEKVARLFNGPDAVHPGIILMTRVDCALKIEHILLDNELSKPSISKSKSLLPPPQPPRWHKFSLPSSNAQINTKLCDKFSVGHYPMLFWGPPTKFSAGWEPNQAKSEIRLIDDGRTAERLLNWINKQISRYEIARAVYDVEEATTTAFDVILEHKVGILYLV